MPETYSSEYTQINNLYFALVTRTTPVHGKDLAKRIGIPERDIRDVVYAARKRGIPVVSGNDGYSLAHTPEDAEKAAKRLRSHAIRELLAGRCLRRWARQERLRLEHPGVLFDMEVAR